MEPSWKKFNAMGTEIVISAFLNARQAHLLEKAEEIVRAFEKRFSRFLVGNELDEFNKFPGGEFQPSAIFLDILKKARALYLETNGIFDPTVIGSLEAVGYDKSFVEIAGGGDKRAEKISPEKIAAEFLSRPRFRDLKISRDKVFKPRNFRMDLGGIGKGYIADFLAQKVFGQVENLWISSGGDLAVRGNNWGKTGWRVGVQDPLNVEKEIFFIESKGRELGIATSGILKRRGQNSENAWHHLIDPTTGLPANNDVLAVTAISSDATRADVFVKTVLLLGSERGLEFIEKVKDAVCVIFLKDGAPLFSKGALSYLSEA